MFTKKMLTSAVLGSLLLLAGTVPAHAWDHHDKCEKRIRKAEMNLDKAVRKHGEHSRQAEHKREQLERERSTCR